MRRPAAPLLRVFSIAALMLLTIAAARAQRIMVRLLNAETGRPLGRENVTVVWDVDAEESTVAVGSDGLGMVQAPRGARTFTVQVGPPIGSEPFRVPYLSCNPAEQRPFSVEQTVQKGAVPDNACGEKSTLASSGEVVFWARPVPSYVADLPKFPRTWIQEKLAEEKARQEKRDEEKRDQEKADVAASAKQPDSR